MSNRQEYMKAYYEAHKASYKAYYQVQKEQIRARKKAYRLSDINSLGQSKHIIRRNSRRILKRMNMHIDGYEIHHCFGYDDPTKFIYISKALHLKIHQYLRDNNINADSNHWMNIKDLINNTHEFTYIKC